MDTVDTALNLAWALLCVAALLRLGWSERRHMLPHSRRSRMLRGIQVSMAGLLLFPCISISDDYARARLQDAASTPGQQVLAGIGTPSSLLLAAQLEETEHIRPVIPFVLVLVLCFLLVILPEAFETRCRFGWSVPGRAPPAV